MCVNMWVDAAAYRILAFKRLTLSISNIVLLSFFSLSLSRTLYLLLSQYHLCDLCNKKKKIVLLAVGNNINVITSIWLDHWMCSFVNGRAFVWDRCNITFFNCTTYTTHFHSHLYGERERERACKLQTMINI